MTVTFNPVKKFEVGNSPFAVAIEDFNGDGNIDLVAANRGSGNVSVLLGDDNGNFSPAQNFEVGGAPGSVTVGDFNGDGISDLATANDLSDNVSVLLGDGSGNFSPAQNFDVGDAPVSVAVGDFNGDGISDLATANQGDPFTAPNERNENISVLLGDGAGGFSPAQNFDVGDTSSVKVGDFNNDGKDDLVTANHLTISDLMMLPAPLNLKT